MQLSLAAIDFNKAPTAEGYYTTVASDAWYADNFVVARANQLDIPGDIDPRAPMTKEAFVHYLVQGLEKTGQYPTVKMFIPIEDEKDITVDFQGTIQRALLYKLTALDDKGEFHPQALITREEAAVMLFNAAEFVESHKDMDNGAGAGSVEGTDGVDGAGATDGSQPADDSDAAGGTDGAAGTDAANGTDAGAGGTEG
ncbi:S-layer homology domain-containing protein, partial [Paenibacillus sepulcri]|nr:S-layer homology domain-containing protein [Paenibacillus sepulcri]